MIKRIIILTAVVLMASGASSQVEYYNNGNIKERTVYLDNGDYNIIHYNSNGIFEHIDKFYKKIETLPNGGKIVTHWVDRFDYDDVLVHRCQLNIEGGIYKMYNGKNILLYELYKNGNKRFEYNSNGELAYEYYENGNVKYEYFRDGEVYRAYYEDGQLKYKTTLLGEKMAYFPDGTLHKAKYIDGSYIEYREDGTKKKEITSDGVLTEYFVNGDYVEHTLEGTFIRAVYHIDSDSHKVEKWIRSDSSYIKYTYPVEVEELYYSRTDGYPMDQRIDFVIYDKNDNIIERKEGLYIYRIENGIEYKLKIDWEGLVLCEAKDNKGNLLKTWDPELKYSWKERKTSVPGSLYINGENVISPYGYSGDIKTLNPSKYDDRIMVIRTNDSIYEYKLSNGSQNDTTYHKVLLNATSIKKYQKLQKKNQKNKNEKGGNIDSSILYYLIAVPLVYLLHYKGWL